MAENNKAMTASSFSRHASLRHCSRSWQQLYHAGREVDIGNFSSEIDSVRGSFRNCCFNSSKPLARRTLRVRKRSRAVQGDIALLCSACRCSIISCCAGPPNRHGGIRIETQYGSTKTRFSAGALPRALGIRAGLRSTDSTTCFGNMRRSCPHRHQPGGTTVRQFLPD